MPQDMLEQLGSGSYFEIEGALSQSSQQSVSQFQTQTSALSMTQKQTIKDLLTEVETYISDNRDDAQQKLSALTQSESIVNNQLQAYSDDDTITQLNSQPIPSNILNLSITNYAENYSDMNELKYRLSIIAYQKNYLKQLMTDYNSAMVTLQNYVIALGT